MFSRRLDVDYFAELGGSVGGDPDCCYEEVLERERCILQYEANSKDWEERNATYQSSHPLLTQSTRVLSCIASLELQKNRHVSP